MSWTVYFTDSLWTSSIVLGRYMPLQQTKSKEMQTCAPTLLPKLQESVDKAKISHPACISWEGPPWTPFSWRTVPKTNKPTWLALFLRSTCWILGKEGGARESWSLPWLRAAEAQTRRRTVPTGQTSWHSPFRFFMHRDLSASTYFSGQCLPILIFFFSLIRPKFGYIWPETNLKIG